MIIGVIRESQTGEARVSATPDTAAQLVNLGYDVVVEPGAGAGSKFTDEAYVAAGATIGDALKADIVFGVNAPSAKQLDAMRDGATLAGILSPELHPGLVEDLVRRPITALAIDAVPRISRAQSLDVLSSMANIAGYRAVIEAAHVFGRFFIGQVTAAGKVAPAKVLVAGAGVAGLAAIGAAGSLGAIVRATDPRPEVADQVRWSKVPGWGVPLRRVGRRGGQRDRVCQGDVRRIQRQGCCTVRAAVQGSGHDHHDRAHPRQTGAAAYHRRDGGQHEAGQRHCGHGGRERRQCRGHRAR